MTANVSHTVSLTSVSASYLDCNSSAAASSDKDSCNCRFWCRLFWTSELFNMPFSSALFDIWCFCTRSSHVHHSHRTARVGIDCSCQWGQIFRLFWRSWSWACWIYKIIYRLRASEIDNLSFFSLDDVLALVSLLPIWSHLLQFCQASKTCCLIGQGFETSSSRATLAVIYALGSRLCSVSSNHRGLLTL